MSAGLWVLVISAAVLGLLLRPDGSLPQLPAGHEGGGYRGSRSINAATVIPPLSPGGWLHGNAELAAIDAQAAELREQSEQLRAKKLTKLVNEAKAMPVPAHPNEGQQVTALLSSVRATKQLVKDKRQRELEEMRAWLVYEQGSCPACGAEDPHGCLSAGCAWTKI